MENIKKTMPDEEAGRINLQSYWKIFWRKKYYFLVPLVLSAVIAAVGVRRLTPIYESHTMLAIEDKNILSPTMEQYVPASEDRSQMRNQQFRAMIETRVTSNDFLGLIVQDLLLQRSAEMRGLVESASQQRMPGIPPDEQVMRYIVSLLKRKVYVANTMPGFFTVGVFDTNPSTAHVLAERIAEKFIDVTRQDQILGIRQAGAFSDEQLAIYKDKLDLSERELSRVKREMTDSNVQNNPVNATNINYARAIKQNTAAEAERAGIALRRVRERLVSLMSAAPNSARVTSDETVRNCESKLAGYGEEKLLRDISGSADQPMPQDQFDAATAELRNRITSIVQDEYRSVPTDVQSVIIEYYYQKSLSEYQTLVDRRLQGYIDRYARNYDRTPGVEREFNRLTQEVETNRAIYKMLLESKTSARISEAVQTTNLGLSMTIIERAERPLVPVKPNPLLVILVTVLFGGGCGIGAILLTEYLDDSFRSIEEVERTLRTPVLGTVPKMAAGFAWERKQRGVMILSWIVGIVVIVGVIAGGMFVYGHYLKSSELGIELREDQSPLEVQE